MVVGTGAGLEHLVGDVLDEHRLARADDCAHARGCVQPRNVGIPERRLGLVELARRQQLLGECGSLHHVDDATIGEPWNGEGGEGVEGHIEIETLGHPLAGVREDLEALPPSLGDRPRCLQRKPVVRPLQGLRRLLGDRGEEAALLRIEVVVLEVADRHHPEPPAGDDQRQPDERSSGPFGQHRPAGGELLLRLDEQRLTAAEVLGCGQARVERYLGVVRAVAVTGHQHQAGVAEHPDPAFGSLGQARCSLVEDHPAHVLDCGSVGKGGGDPLQCAEPHSSLLGALTCLLGTPPRLALGLEEPHPLDRRCDRTGEEGEHLGVTLPEASRRPARGVQHTERPVGAEGDADVGAGATGTERVADDVHVVQVLQHERLAGAEHDPRDATSGGDPQAELDVLAEPGGCSSHELLAFVVGEQQGHGIGVEHARYRLQRLREHLVEVGRRHRVHRRGPVGLDPAIR